MKKIFYTDKSLYPSSETAVREILFQYFQIPNATILRTKNGKPYLENSQKHSLFFSVTHTNEKLFIAVSNREIGIDAEEKNREINYRAVIKKFSALEQADIQNKEDFLRLWTIKESVIKWLGGTLALDLKQIRLERGTVFYNDAPLPVTISTLEKDEHILNVCCETFFSDVEWIPFPTPKL